MKPRKQSPSPPRQTWTLVLAGLAAFMTAPDTLVVTTTREMRGLSRNVRVSVRTPFSFVVVIVELSGASVVVVVAALLSVAALAFAFVLPSAAAFAGGYNATIALRGFGGQMFGASTAGATTGARAAVAPGASAPLSVSWKGAADAVVVAGTSLPLH